MFWFLKYAHFLPKVKRNTEVSEYVYYFLTEMTFNLQSTKTAKICLSSKASLINKIEAFNIMRFYFSTQ